MLLPTIRMQWMSDEKGYGLFATEPIPKGTITYCRDPLDVVISQSQMAAYDDSSRAIIKRFAYEPPSGEMILHWDNAKYINHCCRANSLSTGYEFEVAVRDIEAGEEVTTDYRLFSNYNQFEYVCDRSDCPRSGMSELPLEYIDQQIQTALNCYREVGQPLGYLVPESIEKKLHQYLEDPVAYISVAEELPTSG